MLKVSVLIVCIAIFGSALSVELDQQITNARADEIAKWAGSKLPEYCGLSGELFVQNVDSVKNELEGDKVRFDMEVSYGTVGDEVNFKSCVMSVIDIPTENVRLFNSQPKCSHYTL